MAYVLQTTNGKKFSTTSFYEYTLEKERLRSQGVKFQESLTGVEKASEKKYLAQKKWERLNNKTLNSGDKKAIRRFLGVCDIVKRDYKYKFERDKNGRASSKSKTVGQRKTNQ